MDIEKKVELAADMAVVIMVGETFDDIPEELHPRFEALVAAIQGQMAGHHVTAEDLSLHLFAKYGV